MSFYRHIPVPRSNVASYISLSAKLLPPCFPWASCFGWCACLPWRSMEPICHSAGRSRIGVGRHVIRSAVGGCALCAGVSSVRQWETACAIRVADYCLELLCFPSQALCCFM